MIFCVDFEKDKFSGEAYSDTEKSEGEGNNGNYVPKDGDKELKLKKLAMLESEKLEQIKDVR